MKKEEILEGLIKAVKEYDVESAKRFAEESIKASIDPAEVIEKGPAKALGEIGEMFGRGELFLPELIAAAEAGQAAIEILNKEISKQGKTKKSVGKVLIGTVEGDIHSIGKSIVATMLQVAGFEIVDLGVDVPTQVFVEKTKELKPDIVALSALLTTTMIKQREVIEALNKAKLRNKVKVIIGGAPVTGKWAEEIGADAYGRDAQEGVKNAVKLMHVKS
jgi:trimethylamine corrinoid protein